MNRITVSELLFNALGVALWLGCVEAGRRVGQVEREYQEWRAMVKNVVRMVREDREQDRAL